MKMVRRGTPPETIPADYSVVRYAVKVQSNSFALNEDKTATKGSRLDWPKASLMEYDGKTLTIYKPGRRDLTPEEKAIIDGEPKDDKQDEIDMLSDGSTMFYRRKSYYQNSGHFYLFGTERTGGKRLTHDQNRNPKIEEDAIRGDISLVYEVVI